MVQAAGAGEVSSEPWEPSEAHRGVVMVKEFCGARGGALVCGSSGRNLVA